MLILVLRMSDSEATLYNTRADKAACTVLQMMMSPLDSYKNVNRIGGENDASSDNRKKYLLTVKDDEFEI